MLFVVVVDHEFVIEINLSLSGWSSVFTLRMGLQVVA